LITGEVYVEGRTDHAGAMVTANGHLTTTAPNGSFSLKAPGGTYTVTASLPGYLPATKANVALGSGETKDLGTVTLLSGDATGDGMINAADLAQIAAHLNTLDAASDINASGLVDIYHLVLAGLDFKKSSSPWD